MKILITTNYKVKYHKRDEIVSKIYTEVTNISNLRYEVNFTNEGRNFVSSILQQCALSEHTIVITVINDNLLFLR